jgi:hypothetical protein
LYCEKKEKPQMCLSWLQEKLNQLSGQLKLKAKIAISNQKESVRLPPKHRRLKPPDMLQTSIKKQLQLFLRINQKSIEKVRFGADVVLNKRSCTFVLQEKRKAADMPKLATGKAELVIQAIEAKSGNCHP